MRESSHLVAAGIGATAALVGVILVQWLRKSSNGGLASGACSCITCTAGPVLKEGFTALVGRTPLVRLASLSQLTGCEVWAKLELCNPAGSSKDRIALQIVQDAVAAGRLRPGGTLVEGTSGSTGISLSLLARALGYKSRIALPDDTAPEKQALLRTLGAHVQVVKPVSITHTEHYVNVARRMAEEMCLAAGGIGAAMPSTPRLPTATELLHTAAESGAHRSLAAPATPHVVHFGLDKQASAVEQSSLVEAAASAAASPALLPPADKPSTGTAASQAPAALFCDQFDTSSNFRAHYTHTGPEIWTQTGGTVDVFVSGAGTGGTIAGAGAYLKAASGGKVRVVLADPPGSALFNRIASGVAFAPQQAERSLRRHRYDTIVEGVGVDRMTANFKAGLPHIDGAYRVADADTVAMSRFLLAAEGLFVGSSSAMAAVGALRAAVEGGGKGRTVVTLLCDSGSRHLSRFWHDGFIAGQGLSGDGIRGTAAAEAWREGRTAHEVLSMLLPNAADS